MKANNELQTKIKKYIFDHISTKLVVVFSALIGSATTLVVGALSFQLSASDRLFTVEASALSSKEEISSLRQDLNAYIEEERLVNSKADQKSVELEKRLDRIESKLDQLILQN